jgi:hypothetical protein
VTLFTATHGCPHLSSLQLTDYYKTLPVSLSLSLFLSNCHCKTCHINLYQQPITTCTKQMYQQSVTIISSTKPDLITKTNHQNNSQPYAQYHQDVHQTKLLITTHNHHPHMPLPSMYQSQPSTNLYHNKCINHAQKTYSKLTNKGPLAIHHTIHKLNTINPYIKPCAKTSLLCSLKYVPLISQSYTKTTNKCLSQCTTRYANKTKLSAPTMCLNRSSSNHTLQHIPYIQEGIYQTSQSHASSMLHNTTKIQSQNIIMNIPLTL